MQVRRIVVGKRWRVALVLLAVWASPELSLAAGSYPIYIVDSDTAAIHLSDRLDGRDGRVIAGASAPAAPHVDASDTHRPMSRRRARVESIVHQAAVDHALDPRLLHAMITVESGYAVRAVSLRGALGLMQLMPATAREYGVGDPFDPRQNVQAGALHLRRLLDQFGQDISLALAAYNAGGQAVLRHGRTVPPFAETRAYVPRVLQLAGVATAVR